MYFEKNETNLDRGEDSVENVQGHYIRSRERFIFDIIKTRHRI